jgi:hypothetical protein
MNAAIPAALIALWRRPVSDRRGRYADDASLLLFGFAGNTVADRRK